MRNSSSWPEKRLVTLNNNGRCVWDILEMFDSCIHVCTHIYIYIIYIYHVIYIYMYLCVYRQVCLYTDSIYSNSRFMCSLLKNRANTAFDLYQGRTAWMTPKKCLPNVVDKNWIVMLLKPCISLYIYTWSPKLATPLSIHLYIDMFSSYLLYLANPFKLAS